MYQTNTLYTLNYTMSITSPFKQKDTKGYTVKYFFRTLIPLPEKTTVSLGYIRLIYMKLPVFNYFDKQQ